MVSIFSSLRTVSQQRKSPLTREVALYAGILVGGLIGVAPLFATLITVLHIPIPLPLLVGVVGVGGFYGVVAVQRQQLPTALVIASLITATFSANVPIMSGAGAYPGNLGPNVWLFQLPLLGSVAVIWLSKGISRQSFSRSEYALLFFVGWAFLGAILGNPIRQDVALFYVLYIAMLPLGFGVVSRAVHYRWLTLRQTALVVCMSAFGHAAFSILQIVNHHPFGFGFLGETSRYVSTNVIPTPLGDIGIGVFVSGFTGGGGPLSILLVVAIPLVIGLTLSHPWRHFGQRYRRLQPMDSWRVRLGIIVALFLTAVLRATAKDAARLSLLAAFVAAGGICLWLRHETSDSLLPSLRSPVSIGGAVAACGIVGVTILPSSKSGAASVAMLKSTPVTVPVLALFSNAPTLQLAIPGVDASSLGIRMQQYIAGTKMMLSHPLFGIGGGNYPFMAPQYGLPKMLNGYLFPLHSVYISIMAETGVVGILAYVGALCGVLWASYCLVRDRRDIFSYGVMAAVLGFCGVTFWVVSVRFTMLMPFWLLAGAIVAEAHIARTT